MQGMKDVVDEALAAHSSKVKLLRIVRNKDVVATVPPSFLGFQHLGRLVYITKNGEIIFDHEKLPDDGGVTREQMKALMPDFGAEAAASGEKSKYEKQVSKIPVIFRDHMPDFYLKPMRYYRKNLFPAGDRSIEVSLAANGEDDIVKTASAPKPSEKFEDDDSVMTETDESSDDDVKRSAKAEVANSTRSKRSLSNLFRQKS